MHQLMTVWGENLDKNNVLPEYPRPQMRRDSYVNLNGVWECTFTSSKTLPEEYNRKILVPFCPESKLSGLQRGLMPNEYLWYRRDFEVHGCGSGRRLLLHFGAVDQQAFVYINGREAGSHLGGYLPFEFDITGLVADGVNTLEVRVRDLTDTTYLARGKQKLNPGGMFYTPVSGIWQTVWLEAVPEEYVKSVKITPDFDNEQVDFEVTVGKRMPKADAEDFFDEVDEQNEAPAAASVATVITVSAEGETVGRYEFTGDDRMSIWLPGFKAWSPETPFLYDYELKRGDDCVTGYFAMRKYSVGTDAQGIPRLFLNNKPYFHNGLLDQGYWPDGIYTAPTDEALAYDIIKCKEMGFNMLRKHAKVEPLRWYYHCDRLGMLVWQDIVNGGEPMDSAYVTYRPTVLPFTQTTTNDVNNRHLSRTREKSRKSYVQELKGTIALLYNAPCIALWTLFNEGWGQFDSLDMVKLARSLDPTRTLDHASGWFDRGGSDLKSLHIYFTSFNFKQDKRPVVISEFGGYSLPTPGHVACDKVYGYRKFNDREAFTQAYEKLYREKIIAQLDRGLCAAVYTQVSDIEEEINGLLTYDRKTLKIDSDVVHKINIDLCYHE